MVKRFYNNEHEKAKWDFTKKFVEKHVSENDVVFEGFAGLGYITSFYLRQCKHVYSVERDLETYNEFCKKYRHERSVTPICADSYVLMKELETNTERIQVIDLDPWGAAKIPIIEALRILKEGFLIMTNTAPYWITERHMKLRWFGINPPMTEWKNCPNRIFNEFIVPEAKKCGKTVKLLDVYCGTRICRFSVKIRNDTS